MNFHYSKMRSKSVIVFNEKSFDSYDIYLYCSEISDNPWKRELVQHYRP